ncbi:hypothetical protein KCU75_g25, partial [Aureobasidium melanogenum]
LTFLTYFGCLLRRSISLFSIVLSILRLDLGVGCVFSGLLISDSLAVTLDGRWSTVSIRASLLLEVGWEPAMLSMSFSPNDRGSFSLIRSWSTAPIDAWPSLLDLRICRVFFKRLISDSLAQTLLRRLAHFFP